MGPSSADALNSIRGSAEDGPNSWGWQASFGALLSLSALHLFCDGISWEAVHEAPFLCPEVVVEFVDGLFKLHDFLDKLHVVVEVWPVDLDFPHPQPFKN